jgi:hypothetical protein
MPRIRFSGLVRLANGVRRELCGPVTARRREQLRSQVGQAIHLVDRTLRAHGASARAIPGPTRRAIEFIRSVDFDCIETADDEHAVPRTGQLIVRGLTARVERFAEQLGRWIQSADDSGSDLRDEIVRVLQRIEASNARAAVRIEHLTPRSREHLAWLRFMADAENFADYVAALRQATSVFYLVAEPGVWPQPIVVQFRPTQSLFRVRPTDGFTRALLPTPMITLDRGDFEVLARAMFRRRDRRRSPALHAITVSEPYQELHAELEALGGVVEETRGMAHDLAVSFDRVNATYFGGAIPRPRLTWNQAITAHKFGHYNYSTDTVMISRTLDHAAVPEFVVDHVMHHELLHKKHGLRWHNGRGHAHTAEFRRDERLFPQYAEADAFLKRLATRKGIGCYNGVV